MSWSFQKVSIIVRRERCARNNRPGVVNETSFPPGYSPVFSVHIVSFTVSACRLCNFRLPLGLFLFPVTFRQPRRSSSAFLAIPAPFSVPSRLLPSPPGVIEPRNTDNYNPSDRPTPNNRSSAFISVPDSVCIARAFLRFNVRIRIHSLV